MVNDSCSEIMIIDLECGVGGLHHHHTSDQSFYYSQGEEDDNDNENENEEEEEVGSCYSQFYNSNDNEEDEIEIGRLSSSSSDCSVQLNDNYDNNKKNKNKNVVVSILLDDDLSRDCRICQLSLNDNDEKDDDELIELGCCCKDDLALAHQHCADTWFKIKGNKICEICNSIASNLVVANETPSTTQGIMDVNPAATSVATTHMSTATRGRGCINGHRILNFILACLVFAFVISWLFHFNIPS